MARKFGILTPDHLQIFVGWIRDGDSGLQALKKEFADGVVFEAFNEAGLQLTWAEFYELPFPYLLALALETFQIAPMVRRAAEAGRLPEVLKELVDATDEPGHFEYLTEGAALPEVAALLSLIWALAQAFRCISYFSVPMNHLVKRVAEGNDEAFFKAVTVDPISVYAPTMARRLQFAVLQGDSDFLAKYQKALSGPDPMREPHRDLRVVHQVLEDVHGVESAGREAVHDLIVNQLRLYGSTHADSFKALFSRFSAWKKESTK